MNDHDEFVRWASAHLGVTIADQISWVHERRDDQAYPGVTSVVTATELSVAAAREERDGQDRRRSFHTR